LDGFAIPDFADRLKRAEITESARQQIPTLLKSYIRAGAVIAGDPAIDLDFNCGDLFVVMDIAKMSSTYNRKYQVN
jgi:putative hemolysin